MAAIHPWSAIIWGATLFLLLSRVLFRWQRLRRNKIAARVDLGYVAYALLFAAASAGLTRHAMAAVDTQPVLSPIQSLPSLRGFYLAVHLGLLVWLLFGDLLPSLFRLPAVWPALFLYSSYLYFPTFFAAEQGPPYVLLYVLVIAHALVRSQPQTRVPNQAIFSRRLRYALFALLVVLGISTALSLAPGLSLDRYLQVLCFACLPFLLARDLSEKNRWILAAGWLVMLGGVALAALAIVKFSFLERNLGLIPALLHRLFISDIGPNWISRALVALVPLSAALSLVATRQRSKLLWAAASASLIFTIAYSQSTSGLSGWMALALGLGVLFSLVRWPAIRIWWQSHRQLQVPLGIGFLLLAVTLVLLGGLLALQINHFSFSGRFYVWRLAVEQIKSQPLFGTGMGVRHMTTRIGALVPLDLMAASVHASADFPLSQAWQRELSTLHTHNLFLEVAVGSGLLGLLAFLWYLWELGKHSLSALQSAARVPRVIIVGCIAGVCASIAWGLLDVMEFSPSFFTFPTWALIGLLLAAPHTFKPNGGQEMEEAMGTEAAHSSAARSSRMRTIGRVLLGAMAVLSVVALIGSNLLYRHGYTAFQERRWTDAVEFLERAAVWNPLKENYHQLRGEALINLGDYGEATSALESALSLKRGFAPYYSKLGWLYWLRGDLETATTHLQAAVEMDPREAWRDGLSADLGLAYAAQGRTDEAVQSFKESLELDSEMALAPYWLAVQGENGQFDVVLDPVYLTGPSAELDKRILTHLGKASHTPRLLARPPTRQLERASLTFEQVLDAVEMDYQIAQLSESRETPRLLATVAEGARLAGLRHRAKTAYLAYQTKYPKSAFGFRDLARVYREQGLSRESQEFLVHAVALDPQDLVAWVELAKAYIESEMWVESERALNAAYELSPFDSSVYDLQARLNTERGDISEAAAQVRKSLVVRDSLPNHLLLAGLYRQLDDPERAMDECIRAAGTMLQRLPLVWDPELWEIGICLAQAGGWEGTTNNWERNSIIPVDIEPCISNVLLGHALRAQGNPQQATMAYQKAADACPDAGAPRFFLGEIYRELGRLELAETEYRHAVQLDPMESLSLLALGRLQWSQSQENQGSAAAQAAALASFDSAVEATPGWGRTHVALGNALLMLGNRQDAALHFHMAQIVDGDTQEGLVYDFVANLAGGTTTSPASNYVRNDHFIVNGKESRVLFMHPDSETTYRVSVPDLPQNETAALGSSARTSGPAPKPHPEGSEIVLAFGLATAPESWDAPGDGVTFAVHIEAAGSHKQVFSSYIDPKQNEIDRRWHHHTVDLSDYAGQSVTFVFETNAGPAGDNRFDWAGWAVPRLLVQ